MQESITLNGTWQFRFADDPEWQTLTVPGGWDALPGAMTRSGPAWYRTDITVPEKWGGRRIWLHFGAVSYHAQLFIDGAAVGMHAGMWDAWRVEISAHAAPGATLEISLLVEKPASLTAGPDSGYYPGAYPLRSTLAGFLPYVWGHAHGGIWQGVTLYATGPTALGDVWVRGTPDGLVTVEAELDGDAPLRVAIYDAAGALIWEAEETSPQPAVKTQRAASPQARKADPGLSTFTFHLLTFVPWSPANPYLYTAVVSAGDSDARTVRFGLRELSTDGAALRLNAQHLYPRMILSWGWYPDHLTPDPGPERVRADMLRLRSLGYNGVKLCLWVPPPYYFDLADELGMLLWLELPLWIPQVNDHLRAQLPIEYAAIVRQVRNHPSVIAYTLGCELNRAVGPEILAPLYALVKTLGGDALVRDNSGSGEAYGGLLDEHADFYDYHFYAEPHLLPALLDHFAPRWRPPQPWLFGEFCDYDTLRALPEPFPQTSSKPGAPLDNNPQITQITQIGSLAASVPPSPERAPRALPPSEPEASGAPASAASAPPWYHSQDATINPQGARWQFDLPWLRERLARAGLLDQLPELIGLSHRHALLHRRLTLELVRAERAVGGYVVTGEADTPISTAGMWDDAGELKFAPEAFAAFNGDLTLLLGWGRRRTWEAGGDRVARNDPRCYRAGQLVRAHILLANDSPEPVVGTVRWELRWADADHPAIAAGTTAFAPVPAAGLQPLALCESLAPDVVSPGRLALNITLETQQQTLTQTWPLWVFPARPWSGVAGVELDDPRQSLAGTPLAHWAGRSATAVIASQWDARLDAWVRGGGRAVVVLPDAGPGPLPSVPLPFWREALRVCAPHPAWGDFPHEGWAAEQFLAMGADRALDAAGVAGVAPILWRLDTRTAAVHHYICALPWGAGRLIVSTLRLWGGQGEQPDGIGRSPAAEWLLRCLAVSF